MSLDAKIDVKSIEKWEKGLSAREMEQGKDYYIEHVGSDFRDMSFKAIGRKFKGYMRFDYIKKHRSGMLHEFPCTTSPGWYNNDDLFAEFESVEPIGDVPVEKCYPYREKLFGYVLPNGRGYKFYDMEIYDKSTHELLTKQITKQLFRQKGITGDLVGLVQKHLLQDGSGMSKKHKKTKVRRVKRKARPRKKTKHTRRKKSGLKKRTVKHARKSRKV